MPPLRYVLQALINTLASGTEQFLLVLDDYHLITEPEIHNTLVYLVEHLPPQLHIMLATRADPPLPLSLLRARAEVLEVRTDQLRCTPEEITAFFRDVMGIQLHADIIQEVISRTEGWLVGLQLLGLTLQGRADPADVLDEVSGSQRYILDYLMEEVLRRQPLPVQTFLLHTSILERLSASLCDAVTQQKDSQEMLEFLERANVFVVPLDGHRRWYRYHALFAEALRSRLEQTEGEAVAALHLRASHWYARQGYLNEAVRHAISAGDWPRAADLIEQEYAFIWGNSEHAMLRRWLEKLPVEIVRSRPRLCLAYAKTLFMIAPYTTMERWLQDAEIALQATLVNKTAETGASPPPERANLSGEIASYRAIITGYYLGDGHATLAFCEEALAHLSEPNLVARAEVAYAQSLAYHSFGDIGAAIQSTMEATALAQAAGNTSSIIVYMSRTAYSLLLHGKLREVVRVAQQAALLGTTSAGLPHAMMCWAYIFHADALRQWNRLDEALNLILQAVRLSEQTETIVALYLGYTVLMRVHLARGEMDAAHLAFQQAEEALAKTYSPYRRDAYLIVDWVQFWVASGALDRAIGWAQELTQQASTHSPFVRKRQDVARVRILLAQKMPTEALSLLEPLQAGAEKQERWSHVIEMKVLQVLAYQMLGQEHKALTALAEAIRLAEGEGYIRVYEHQPQRAGQRMTAQPLLDPLSERELEVLHLIARGDSNQEIAQTLVLAIDTVKRHVSNIFSKLGVHTRVQAVARARSFGLLSDES